MEACWSFLEGRFPSYFFGSTFWTMCPPSSKFITWVFELLIFKLRTLLTNVHTITDSIFSDSLCSTISVLDLYSNELINMYLGLILRQSCMNLPNSGLGPPCYAELFWGQGLPLGISSSSLQVKVLSSASLVRRDLKLRVTLFFVEKVKLESLQDHILL